MFTFHRIDVPTLGEPFTFTEQPSPIQARGFGTNLALFGDLVLSDLDGSRSLMDFLVELFICMASNSNEDGFSILGE